MKDGKNKKLNKVFNMIPGQKGSRVTQFNAEFNQITL